jgi:hypothetical protein
VNWIALSENIEQWEAPVSTEINTGFCEWQDICWPLRSYYLFKMDNVPWNKASEIQNLQ